MLPCTVIVHETFKRIPAIQAWFTAKQGFPADVMAKFGDERLDLDREGKITNAALVGVEEPIQNPKVPVLNHA